MTAVGCAQPPVVGGGIGGGSVVAPSAMVSLPEVPLPVPLLPLVPSVSVLVLVGLGMGGGSPVVVLVVSSPASLMGGPLSSTMGGSLVLAVPELPSSPQAVPDRDSSKMPTAGRTSAGPPGVGVGRALLDVMSPR